MHELALFAGAGGGILGGKMLGWRTVCAVERDAFAASVLAQRQNDGLLEPFPIWSDVQTFDGRPWRGLVDVISGGFPCQDISSAGKGAGIEGERSGMWSQMARIIGEVRPRFVFVENSPLLVGRGLAVVLGDLAKNGYDAKWDIIGAHHAGAPHQRDRAWILAYPSSRWRQNDELRPRWNKSRLRGQELYWEGEELANTSGGRCSKQEGGEIQFERRAEAFRPSENGWWTIDPAELPDAQGAGLEGFRNGSTKPDAGSGQGYIGTKSCPSGIWPIESQLGRMADGVANRVERIRAIGNGQVPSVAAIAWNRLIEGIEV